MRTDRLMRMIDERRATYGGRSAGESNSHHATPKIADQRRGSEVLAARLLRLPPRRLRRGAEIVFEELQAKSRIIDCALDDGNRFRVGRGPAQA